MRRAQESSSHDPSVRRRQPCEPQRLQSRWTLLRGPVRDDDVPVIRALPAAVLLMALAFASCDDGSTAPSATNHGPASAARRSVPDGDSTFGSIQITEDQIRGARAGGSSDFQLSLIEDGRLTFSEYERATFETLTCLEMGGLQIGHSSVAGLIGADAPGPRLDRRGRYEYGITGAQGSRPEDAMKTVAKCSAEYSDIISFFWAARVVPSEQEFIQARQKLAACLRLAGYDVPEHPSGADLMRVAFPPDGQPLNNEPTPAFYNDCLQPIKAELDMPFFLG